MLPVTPPGDVILCTEDLTCRLGQDIGLGDFTGQGEDTEARQRDRSSSILVDTSQVQWVSQGPQCDVQAVPQPLPPSVGLRKDSSVQQASDASQPGSLICSIPPTETQVMTTDTSPAPQKRNTDVNLLSSQHQNISSSPESKSSPGNSLKDVSSPEELPKMSSFSLEPGNTPSTADNSDSVLLLREVPTTDPMDEEHLLPLSPTLEEMEKLDDLEDSQDAVFCEQVDGAGQVQTIVEPRKSVHRRTTSYRVAVESSIMESENGPSGEYV